MKKTILSLSLVAALGLIALAVFLFKLRLDTPAKVANHLVKLINAADYSGVEKLFNEEMSQTLPPDKAADFFKGLNAQFGKMQKLDQPETNSEGIVFPVQCEHGALDMKLALDKKNKISGLIFKPQMDALTKAANRLVEMINAADYPGVEALFNPDMSRALPLDKTTEFLRGLNAQFGRIQLLGAPETNSVGVVFPAHCERGVVDMTLALDEQNKIEGLLFQPQVDRGTKAANRVVELINAADYSRIETLFNENMSKSLPLDKATAFFSGLTGRFGKIQRLGEQKQSGGWTVFPARFERGILDMSLVLDGENKIAGILFKPSGR